jgi:hypothetical protein
VVSEDCNKALKCIDQVSGCSVLKDKVKFLDLISVHFHDKLIKLMFKFLNAFFSLNFILKSQNLFFSFVDILPDL